MEEMEIEMKIKKKPKTKQRIQLLKPVCNLKTVEDGRGAIFSFVPEKPILEWTHQISKAGNVRGNHFHPEFDEYILLINGYGIEVERDRETGEEFFIEMSKGTCIFVPRGTLHVFLAIEDCELVSFLTKRWNECQTPIVHENMGHGKGDHGDPDSAFHKYQHKEAKAIQ